MVLIVSGGHTELVLMKDHLHYQRLGATLDDAAGEAFDKVARLIGLGYPGGPAIQKAAEDGNPQAFNFPRAWLEDTWNFSFSGLKTAVLREVRRLQEHKQRSAAGGRPGSQLPGGGGGCAGGQDSARRRRLWAQPRSWWRAASRPTRPCARPSSRRRPARCTSRPSRCAPITPP